MDNAINIESKTDKDWRERQKELKRKKIEEQQGKRKEREKKSEKIEIHRQKY